MLLDALIQYLKKMLLTNEERDLLKARHRLERDSRICDRIKAVLLRDKGWSFQKISETLLLSDDTIRKHVQEYLDARKLKPENGGSKERLSSKQSQLLLEHLEEHTYLYVKSIAHYIERKWGILYTISGLTNWLKRNGFSYKKPRLVPGKANLKAQEQWILEYEEFKSGLSETETVCFIDGVHPTHNVQISYGWIKKGTEKLIPSNTGRSRINLTGAIDIISHQVVVQEDLMLNAESTISFIQKLEGKLPKKTKIHVFCDNAPYYRNKKVKEYLNSSRVEFHFLPPYSPNLNPIERLWKWMKETVCYNTYYEDFHDFKAAIFGFFSTLSNLDPGSELWQTFKNKIRDRFRPTEAPTSGAL